MSVLFLIDKKNGDVVFSKQFTDEKKANALRNCLDKYLDKTKSELKVEYYEKKKKVVKKVVEE